MNWMIEKFYRSAKVIHESCIFIVERVCLSHMIHFYFFCAVRANRKLQRYLLMAPQRNPYVSMATGIFSGNSWDAQNRKFNASYIIGSVSRGCLMHSCCKKDDGLTYSQIIQNKAVLMRMIKHFTYIYKEQSTRLDFS